LFLRDQICQKKGDSTNDQEVSFEIDQNPCIEEEDNFNTSLFFGGKRDHQKSQVGSHDI
jgi:hypothetical protein